MGIRPGLKPRPSGSASSWRRNTALWGGPALLFEQADGVAFGDGRLLAKSEHAESVANFTSTVFRHRRQGPVNRPLIKGQNRRRQGRKQAERMEIPEVCQY